MIRRKTSIAFNGMVNMAEFFEKPILYSPYFYPSRHWELDADGQPTNRIIEKRRSADFVTPVPKSKKRKTSGPQQVGFTFGGGFIESGDGQAGEVQLYNPTDFIHGVRQQVDQWRQLPNPEDWTVTHQ